MNTQKHLYLNEVQLAIFQQLLTYESLLKKGYFLHIYRYHDGAMKVFLGRKEVWHCIDRFAFDTLPITTAKDVDEAINRWWQSIPDYCKK